MLGDAETDCLRWITETGQGHWAPPNDSTKPLTGILEAELTARRRRIRSKWALVETVFAILVDQFNVETTRARSLQGVETDGAKVLEFDPGV